MKQLYLLLFLLILPGVLLAQDPALNKMKADTDTTYYLAGQTLEVAVKINSGTNFVYSSSSILNFPTQYLQVDTVLPGDHLGSNILFTYIVEETSGKVHMSISQVGNQSGVNGIGTVYIVWFTVNTDPGLNTRNVTFSNSEIDVRNPQAVQLSIGNTNHTVVICEAVVWPGDLNNNGIVAEDDVLQIGLHFGQTGPTRSNATFQWRPEPASLWTDISSVYVDATGNGKVQINDMPPVGFNYGKSHPVSAPLPLAKLASGNSLYGTMQVLSDTTARLLVMADAEDLFGIAFKTFYDPAAVEISNVQLGDYLPNASVFFIHDVPEQGFLATGISLISGQQGVTANSSLIVVDLKLLNSVGSISFDDIVAYDEAGNQLEFTVGVTGLDDEVALPDEYVLAQNYPNPFNPSTTISYSLPQANDVSLKIFNILGREVVTLVNESRNAGQHTVIWNGRDAADQEVTTGVYIYQLRAGQFVQNKKMIFLK